MRVTLCAVGRLRGGPEKALYDDYVGRFNKIGRNLGLGPFDLVEVDPKKPGMAAEAEALERAAPTGTLRCALDERGQVVSSPDWASHLGRWRDQSRDLALFIGGADGLAPDFRASMDFALSFGTMVWPHMLVRVMLAEQMYRAANIMAGTPYHRV
jgi:23S rRNA (pseudouridine1915-N3)-methyltransferase